MKEIIGEKFIINFQEGLDEFVKDSLCVVEERFEVLKNLFSNESESVGKMKASFFTERENFVEYIKSVSNGAIPPEWATGCFYNGEIQTLINLNDEKDVQYKVHTLMHEMVHLYIQELVYSKHSIDRITWFDESCASYIDGHMNNMTKDQISKICEQLKNVGEFDLNILDDINKIKTNEYDGYDMFLIVGKYIFENNLAQKYVDAIKTSPEEIREIGKEILAKSIKYALGNLQ